MMSLPFDRLFGHEHRVFDAEFRGSDFLISIAGRQLVQPVDVSSTPEPDFDGAIPIFVDTFSEELCALVEGALRDRYPQSRIGAQEVQDAIFAGLNHALSGGPSALAALGELLKGRISRQSLLDAAAASADSPFIVVWRTGS